MTELRHTSGLTFPGRFVKWNFVGFIPLTRNTPRTPKSESKRKREVLVTNWFNIKAIARAHNPELWSEEFWPALEKWLKFANEHGQNVFLGALAVGQGLQRACRKVDL